MREIKIHRDASYDKELKQIKSIEVYETNLTFINGLAVVTGRINYKNKFLASLAERPTTCMGIINENFEEVFNGRGASSYLIFYPRHEEIIRVGANDFIVRVYGEDDKFKFLPKFVHIRLVGGLTTIISEDIGRVKELAAGGMVLTFNGLYDSYLGMHYFTEDTSFRILNEAKSKYFILDKMSVKDTYGKIVAIDVLAFQFDVLTKEISPIISSLAGGYITDKKITVEDYQVIRFERLKSMESHQENFNNLTRALINPKREELDTGEE